MNSKRYIKQVDTLLATLRAHLLGLDIGFEHFLPEQGAFMADEEQIRWLTDRMSFMLISSEPWTSTKEAESIWRWLYGSIRYLYEMRPACNHNWNGVLALANTDLDLRLSILSPTDEYLILLRTTEPPAAFSRIEQMVVELTKDQILRHHIEA